ncbi:MAG: 50S ribosomal protein L19 [Tenericutes bacterium]|nr:MAG: 50S ribosomal protein L19 [Mycoplasmatota bacterium]
MGINQDLLKSVTASQGKLVQTELKAGFTVKVSIKIKEGAKERIQIFEGMVIKLSGSGISKTFTVRKNSFGIGVEKTFLFNSPNVTNIEVLKKGKVRRAKILYMRERTGKSTRLAEKQVQIAKKTKKTNQSKPSVAAAPKKEAPKTEQKSDSKE